MEFSELNNLSSALALAVQTGLVSREQAAGIFKKVLKEAGLIEQPQPVKPAEKEKK